jgi:hypothetical protein
MFRPNKNKVKLTRSQSLDRASHPSRRVTPSNPLGTRTVVYPRVGRIVNGERQEDSYWTVTATKKLPWQVRSRNRRNNKIARASRKRNRHG